MSSWWKIDWNKYFQGSNNCMHIVSENFTLEPWPIGIFMLIWSQIQCFSKCTIFQCVSNHRFNDLCDKKKLLLMYWNFHACLLKSLMLCPLSVHLAACQSIYFHLILAHTVMDTLEILCLSRSATVDTTMLAHVFKLINKYIYIYINMDRPKINLQVAAGWASLQYWDLVWLINQLWKIIINAYPLAPLVKQI